MYKRQKQENSHEFHRKFKVEGIAVSEQGNNLFREKLKKNKTDGGNHKIAANGKLVDAADAVVFFCAVVKADNWL